MPPDAIVDVPYSWLGTTPEAGSPKLYEAIGARWTDAEAARLPEAAGRRRGARRHTYDLARYGLDREASEMAFADYNALRAEVDRRGVIRHGVILPRGGRGFQTRSASAGAASAAAYLRGGNGCGSLRRVPDEPVPLKREHPARRQRLTVLITVHVHERHVELLQSWDRHAVHRQPLISRSSRGYRLQRGIAHFNDAE